MASLYENIIRTELQDWKEKMIRRPSAFNRLSKSVQTGINNRIPEKVHKAITVAVKQMIRSVLFGAKITAARPLKDESLFYRENEVRKHIDHYRKAAAVEGGITGAGGILLGLADFPLLIGIKIKLLFEIAAAYGFDVDDYKERLYILYIFELAFSGDAHRKEVFEKIADWENTRHSLPATIHEFDWRSMQQEYRDYLDVAKMAQLLPVIGAPVGIWINNKLIKKLGLTAMNAYRMRLPEP